MITDAWESKRLVGTGVNWSICAEDIVHSQREPWEQRKVSDFKVLPNEKESLWLWDGKRKGSHPCEEYMIRKSKP